jgi:hypothetical protein
METKIMYTMEIRDKSIAITADDDMRTKGVMI